MKIFIKKATAVFLAVIMIIGCSIAGFAGVQPEAGFSITKINETPENVVLSFNLVSGSFSSIDFTTTIVGENLICDSITLSDTFTAWDTQSDFVFTPDIATGNVTLSSDTAVCDSAIPVVIATYSKTEGKGGIVKADFSAAVNACSTIIETQTTPVTASVTVDIAETHSHITPEAYTVTKEASCKEAGLKVKACPECGEILDSQTIEKKEHKLVSLRQNATCTEDGYTVKVCTVCECEFDKVVIPAKKHNWSEWKTIKAATAAEPGLKERYCSNCHDVDQKEIPQIYTEPKSVVILANKKTSLKYGTSMPLAANMLPAEASYSNSIEWKSSNPKVVTVDETGLVTAKGYGTATITASTCNGKIKDSVTIQVKFSLWQIIVDFIRNLLGNL